MFFPVKDFTEEQRIAGTYPYTSAVLCGIKILRRVLLRVRPPRHRRDACSMALLVAFHTGAICISISAVLSLAIAVIHFRMPCWEAETKDPEWFY